MATSDSLTPAPSALDLTTEDGMNMLWRFQLRKENAAILEKQDAHFKQIQAMAAENERTKKEFDERIAAMEVKLSTIYDDEKRDRHAIEKWVGEVAALKSQVGIVMEKQEKRERQLVDYHNSGIQTEKPPVLAHPDPYRGSPSDTTGRSMNGLYGTHESPSRNTSNPSIIPPVSEVSGPTMNTTLRTANRNTNKKSTEPTRPTTRSRTKSLEQHAPLPRLRTAHAPTLKQNKVPRLSQGTGALRTYFANASKTFATLPNDQKLEIDFIALFIKGIRDAKLREEVIGELQQKHQSRTKKDGKVEILCKWEDVGVGMRRAGLIQNETGSGNAGGNTGRASATGHKKSQIPNMLRELI